MSATSFLWLQNIRARAVYRHPLYGKPVKYSNDIVLIKLARQAKMNKRVGLVCLTNDTKLFAQGRDNNDIIVSMTTLNNQLRMSL